MRDRSSSVAMSAIVVGTYVFALYGAFGTPVKARPPAPDRPTLATTRPMPTTQAVASVADLAAAR